MIHPQELRIGNIVLKTSTGNQHVLSPNDITNFANSVLMRPMFEPIPLTEEWLVKFGFEVVMFGSLRTDSFALGSFSVHKVGGNNSTWQIGLYGKMLNVFVDYVHQLQNAHQVLRGSELTIKE